MSVEKHFGFPKSNNEKKESIPNTNPTQKKEHEFEWYVFTNDNRITPVAGFNDGQLALDLMHSLGDGSIRVNKIWLEQSNN